MIKARTATILTIVWLGLGALIVFEKIDSVKLMPLNEIGDFLAGFFSPVAFLWLVVGYFQQGEELKLNTQVLELQVKELKLSVEQQRELVDVTRSDVQLAKQAYQLEIERERKNAQPIFQLQVGSSSNVSIGITHLNVTLSNHGHRATGLKLKCTNGAVTPSEIDLMPKDDRKSISVDLSSSPSWDFAFEIEFQDGFEQHKRQVFSAIRGELGTLGFLPPKEFLVTDC